MSDKRGFDNTTPLQDGEAVVIDLERIRNMPDYDRFSRTYKEFLDEHGDEVFHVKRVRKELYILKEYPEWLFWRGNLLKA